MKIHFIFKKNVSKKYKLKTYLFIYLLLAFKQTIIDTRRVDNVVISSTSRRRRHRRRSSPSSHTSYLRRRTRMRDLSQ